MENPREHTPRSTVGEGGTLLSLVIVNLKLVHTVVSFSPDLFMCLGTDEKLLGLSG